MSPLPRIKPILPWWQLAALLALCATGIYFLLPDDPKLLENLIRDGQTREARRLLERIPPETRARDADRIRLLELKLARKELPPRDPAALQDFLRLAVSTWRDSRHSDSAFFELAAVLPQLLDPAAAWQLIAPELAAAPAKQRALLGEQLPRLALAQGQPAVAAEAFAATHPAPSRTPAQSLELARLWQLAGRPADALAALPDTPDPVIAERRLALFRELNRNREALALLRQRIEASTTPPDAALVTQAADIALAAGAPAEAVPVFERYLGAHPDDLPALRRLRALLVASGEPARAIALAERAAALSQRHVDDLLELARIYEWSARANSAFDIWLELALRDHPGALDRLLALNPGLFRDADLARALQHALSARAPGSPSGHPHLLALARLQVELGHYGRARETFERYLAAQPDPAVMREVARVHRENFEFAPAETWLRRAAAAQPGDIPLQRELAELLVFQGRHTDALALYGALVERSDDEDIIGPFTRLAEALGRFDEFARGMARRVATSRAPSERDFILLAYAHELAANPGGRRAAIDDGLRRHPASDDLRLQFAYLLAAEQNHKLALQTLSAHTRLRQDFGALTLYLDLLRLTNDTAAERRFLAEPLPPAALADEGVLERLARSYEAQRDYAAAGRIWRDLLARRPEDVARAAELARFLLTHGKAAEARALLAPFLRDPTPPVLKLAAEIAEAAGDHRNAEKYQLAYLAALKTAPATDWGALGDIRLSRGDRTGAKRAYAEALRRLHANIAQKGPTR